MKFKFARSFFNIIVVLFYCNLSFNIRNFKETFNYINEFLKIDNLEKLESLNSGVSLNEIAFNCVYVKCLDSEKILDNDDGTFHFVSNAQIDRVDYNCKNNIMNIEINENDIMCTVSLLKDNLEIKFSFFSKDKLIDCITLYFIKGNNGNFYSSALSFDVAKRNAGKSLDYKLVKDLNILDNIKENKNLVKSVNSTKKGVISGTFKWTDDQGKIHPLSGAMVIVMLNDFYPVSIAFTDKDGFYSVGYSNNLLMQNVTVSVYASDGGSISVDYDGTYAKSKVFNVINKNVDFSYTFSPLVDGDMGKAIIIFQAAKNFSNFATICNNGVAISNCKFIYPGNHNEKTYYSTTNECVMLEGDEFDEDNRNLTSYSSWDTIGHEYGHHVQHYFGITDNPGGVHSVPSNNIDKQFENFKENGERNYTLEKAKERGLKLAWGEGWPTFWSTIAQSTFSDDLKSIYTVGDTKYTSYNRVNYDLDAYTYNEERDSFGDADEIAIQQFLYKLCSVSTDEYDKFSIDFEIIWNLVIVNKPFTFYEFVNDLYEAGYDKNDLGKLLSQYKIAIGDLSISDNYLDECPTFTWSTDLGSSYLYYDSFDLVFLNPRKQEVLRIDNIKTDGSIGKYTLSKDEWSQIISIYGKQYYVYIVARQTLSFISGNYYSELFTFNEPDDFNKKVQIKPEERGFEPQYFFESNKKGHASTTISDHNLFISTERLRCGYIENSYVVLSPKRENAGKAYLELRFDKPVYSYMFGIALWSKNEGLDNATCTAIVESMDIKENWKEDFDLLNDLPNGFSIKSDHIDRYETLHKEGIYGLRFTLTSPATGNRNKGRVCIDDLVFNLDKDDLNFISTSYV